jgi:hypothetical protein
LALTVTGGADSAAVVVQNVETINIRDVIGADSFNAILIEDNPTINFTNTIAGQTSTVINAALGSTYGLSGAGNMTVDFIGTGGDSDTAKVNLNGTGTDDANSTVNVSDTNTIEAVTVVTSGTNYATLTSGTAAETVTISGSGTNELTITGAAAIAINASASTAANTLVMGTTLSSTDTITGGSGTDTVTATINLATTVRPTASAVETYELGFTAAGTLDARNVTGVRSIEIDNMTADATVTRLASTATTLSVTENTATTEDVAIGYAASSNSAVTLTVGASDETNTDQVTDIGDVTLTGNEGALTIVSAGEDANLLDAVAANDVASLTIDARTQGLTTTTVGAAAATAIALKATAGSLVTGAITATDAEDITLTLNSGDLTTGLITSAADVDVSITANSDAGDDVTTSLDVDALRNLTVSASAGSDVTITAITLSGENPDVVGDDINVEFNLTAAADSTVTIQDLIERATGTAVEIDSIVMAGAGNFSITADDADIDIVEIDGVSVTGDVTINLATNINNVLTIETGSGDDTISGGSAADTINGGSGDDSITGGAAADDITLGAGDDTVVLTATATTDAVQDFNADDDAVALSVAGLEADNGDGDAIAAGTATLQIQTIASAAAIAVGTEILVLTGDLANAEAMENELDDLAFADDNIVADDDLIVVWSDGTDTFVSIVNLAVTDDGATSSIDDTGNTVSTLVQLIGVDIADLAAANFSFVA